MRIRRDFVIEAVCSAEAMDPVPQVPTSAVHQAPLHGVESDRGTRAEVPEAQRKDETGRYSAYPRLMKEVEIHAMTPSTRGTVLPADQFMRWRIRSFEEARDVTPALVWAALTEDVRKSHLKELKALQLWMARCPSVCYRYGFRPR